MDFTYLDYFNYYLKEFCNQITANFPDFERGLVENYRPLLESKQCKNDLYVKCFISKVNNCMDKICNKDQTLFEPSTYVDKETGLVGGLFLLEGVDFLKLWSSTFNTAENQASIWKYLQLLTIIGRKIVPNKAEVLELLNSVGTQIHAPAKVEKTLLGPEEDLGDAGNKPDLFGLGNLTSLAGLMGLGGGGEGGLTDMLKSVGDMFSGIDLKGFAEEMQKAQAVGEAQAESLTSTGTCTGCEDESHQHNTSAEAPREPTSTEQGTGAAGNLFVDMAQEMANTFDFGQLESGDQPANMADAFKKLMSGDNPKKIAGLISKFGNKIQSEIASGKLNHADLLKQTTQMMPGMGGGNMEELKKQAEKMMKGNPGLAAQAEQMRKQQQKAAQGGMTKDRLRAKLEAKKQTEQGGEQNK
jgi:hypothetical protein